MEDEFKLESVSEDAGKYLEGLGKTDLAAMTRDEWLGFLRAVIIAYQNAPPF